MQRPYNFSAGPAAIPEEVLRQAAAEMLDWHGSGMGVMEMSHRGKEFISIYEAAEAGFVNLKGHRLVGGMRASIYNAMPAEGVDKLVDFMEKFRKENA